VKIIKLGSNNFLSTLKKATTVAGDVLTTKGDILSRSASALGRLGIGSNDQVLTADSAQPLGLKWATAGGGGTSFQEIVRKTSDQANDTTNLVNDSQLKLAIGTSKTFVFTFYAILHETSTSDWKLTVTAPTNATGGFYNSAQNSSAGQLNSFSDIQTGSNSTNTGVLLVISGWCTTDGSNAGDIQFQFAENSANANGVDSLTGGWAYSVDVT
tara:strand:- start:70 stop:708 length:639 start_codon:yes stop_codon:yes gene_type:complete